MDAVTSVSSLPGYLDMTETAEGVPVIDASVFGKLPIYYSEAPASTPAKLSSSMVAPECPLRNWKPLYLGLAVAAVQLLMISSFRTAR